DRRPSADAVRRHFRPALMGIPRRHRHRQRMDAVCPSADRGSLVQLSQPALVRSRTAAGGYCAPAAAGLARTGAWRRPVPVDLAAGLSRLQRPGHQPLALRRAARPADPGCGRPASEPGFHPGRRAARHTRDPDLYRLVVLGIQGQGPGRGGLPLNALANWLRRVAWLLALWSGGVIVVAGSAWLLRAAASWAM